MNITINLSFHGVKGACVQYTDKELRRDIKEARKLWTKTDAQKMVEILRKTLTDMLPDIINKGISRDPFGEIYTKEIFDQDLVCLAVYDHIGNDRPIALAFDPAKIN
jgi:hypothetical protein